MELICHFEVNIQRLEKRFSIRFISYFEECLLELLQMQSDGLIKLNNESLKVMERGKLLVRNVCMVFDTYLKFTEESFSKTI